MKRGSIYAADLLRYLHTMIKIEFPEKRPAVKMVNGEEKIFCLIRKKWLKITPEEWVRQNFILYLNLILGYPLSLVSVEKKVEVGELQRRFDIVVYNRDYLPFMLIECKEMNVPLSEKVMQQVLAYNNTIHASFIVITNGLHCMAVQRKGKEIIYPEALPVYPSQ